MMAAGELMHDSGIRGGRITSWPAGVDIDPAGLRRGASYSYLLDADTDLAEEFDLRMRIVARQVATALVIDVPTGRADLDPWFDSLDRGLGLLLLDGVLAADTHVGDRTTTELVGAGDLLQPWRHNDEQFIERSAAWHVIVPARLAILDAGFAERVRPWPQLMQALLERAGKRARNVAVQRAINSQPRLEVRLTLFLWHLAARWGRVERGGIRLDLPLTHALIGRLVGAERPSVSHALSRLADAGLVVGGSGDLHLQGTLEEHLAHLAERAHGKLATRVTSIDR